MRKVIRWREHDGVRIVHRGQTVEGIRGDIREHEERERARVKRYRLIPNLEISEFVEREWFPQVEATCARSTVTGYRDMWRVHGYRLAGRIRDFKTIDAQRVLQELGKRDLAASTLRHIKAFYSAIFSYARLVGVRDDNPWIGTRLPKGRVTEDTVVYTASEVRVMLEVLPEPARAIVGIMAYTGLRKSEVQGLTWGDVNLEHGELRVSSSYVNGTRGDTKSRASRSTVPLAPQAIAILRAHREKGVVVTLQGDSSHSIPVFVAGDGKTPLDLHNLANRVISPLLSEVGLKWRGFHGMRRGLASFLYSQGVPDLTVAKILRHSNVNVSRKHYIRVIEQDVRDAMENVKYEREGGLVQ